MHKLKRNLFRPRDFLEFDEKRREEKRGKKKIEKMRNTLKPEIHSTVDRGKIYLFCGRRQRENSATANKIKKKIL